MANVPAVTQVIFRMDLVFLGHGQRHWLEAYEWQIEPTPSGFYPVEKGSLKVRFTVSGGVLGTQGLAVGQDPQKVFSRPPNVPSTWVVGVKMPAGGAITVTRAICARKYAEREGATEQLGCLGGHLYNQFVGQANRRSDRARVSFENVHAGVSQPGSRFLISNQFSRIK